MGSMSDYFEGGIYLDDVQPITSGGVPIMSVTPMELDFGETETLMSLDIHNTGGGTLEWTAAENPDAPWITSVSPASGTGNAAVEVTVDRALLEGSSATGTISVSSNGGDQDVTVTILGESTSPWKHPEIETKVLAGGGVEGHAFGRFVDIDGDYLIVGASDNENANGDRAGAAYIYKGSGDDWG